MTEEEARASIAARFGVEATDRLALFLAMVASENSAQNLIAPSTIPAIWTRHALDSAQLVPLGQSGLWIDIGTGGGFPGMVVGILRADPVLLVEPRRKRAAFLEHCAVVLGLKNIRVAQTKIDALTATATTISARAVASVENLLQMAAGCATKRTRWLLPRGRLPGDEIASLRQRWKGLFHVEQSLTDPESSILVLDEVSRR